MTQEKNVSGKAAIAQLAKMGFSDAIIEEPRRLVVSVEGLEGTGKTHFALTAPEPIFYFNIDIGAKGVMGKFQRSGKKIYNKDIKVRKGKDQSVYDALWTDFCNCLYKACDVGTGTIVVDTASEAYELARLARFGKLEQVPPHFYSQVNSIWKEVMRVVYDSPMNAVFIHKVKPVWENNQRTKNYEVAGFSDTGYMVEVRLDTGKRKKEEGNGADFFWTVKKCRPNHNIEGMTCSGQLPDGTSMMSFDWLLDSVFDA